MRSWRIHFGRERNVKNNEIRGSKNTAAASSSKQSSSICLEEPAEEKGDQKSTAWSRSKYEYPGTCYVSHEGHLRQTTTNKLEAKPAAKGRGNERQMRHSHASSVLSRRATSAAPAQRKNYRYPSFASRWDHEKQIYFGDPQTGEVY